MLGGRARRWIGGLILVVALARAPQAWALHACNAGDITSQDPGCPPGDGPCTITLSFDTSPDDICDFDFGARAVVLKGSLQSTDTIDLFSAALAIDPGGAIRAPYVNVETTGDVWIKRQDRDSRGLINVVGTGGGISVSAGGNLRIDGDVLADATRAVRDGSFVVLSAGAAGVVLGVAGLISANASVADPDFETVDATIEIASPGPIVLDGTISKLGGGDQGYLMVESEHDAVTIGGRLRLDGWYALESGSGLLVYADTGVQIGGKVTTVAGPTTLASGPIGYEPFSGEVVVTTRTGNVVVSGEIITDGVLYGCPGGLGLRADGGDVVVSGSLSVRAHRLHVEIAEVSFDAGDRVDLSGALNVANGAAVYFKAPEIDLSGTITGHILAGQDFGERHPRVDRPGPPLGQHRSGRHGL